MKIVACGVIATLSGMVFDPTFSGGPGDSSPDTDTIAPTRHERPPLRFHLQPTLNPLTSCLRNPAVSSVIRFRGFKMRRVVRDPF